MSDTSRPWCSTHAKCFLPLKPGKWAQKTVHVKEFVHFTVDPGTTHRKTGHTKCCRPFSGHSEDRLQVKCPRSQRQELEKPVDIDLLVRDRRQKITERVQRIYQTVVSVPATSLTEAEVRQQQRKRQHVYREKDRIAEKMEDRIQEISDAYHQSVARVEPVKLQQSELPTHEEAHMDIMMRFVTPVSLEQRKDMSKSDQLRFYFGTVRMACHASRILKQGDARQVKPIPPAIAQRRNSANCKPYKEFVGRLSYLVSQGRRKMSVMGSDLPGMRNLRSLDNKRQTSVSGSVARQRTNKTAYRHKRVSVAGAVRVLLSMGDKPTKPVTTDNRPKPKAIQHGQVLKGKAIQSVTERSKGARKISTQKAGPLSYKMEPEQVTTTSLEVLGEMDEDQETFDLQAVKVVRSSDDGTQTEWQFTIDGQITTQMDSMSVREIDLDSNPEQADDRTVQSLREITSGGEESDSVSIASVKHDGENGNVNEGEVNGELKEDSKVPPSDSAPVPDRELDKQTAVDEKADVNADESLSKNIESESSKSIPKGEPAANIKSSPVAKSQLGQKPQHTQQKLPEEASKVGATNAQSEDTGTVGPEANSGAKPNSAAVDKPKAVTCCAML